MNRTGLTAAQRIAVMLLVIGSYLPWWAQRRAHASTAPIRTVVAGRQSGKTHWGAEETVRIMLRRPGSTSCLLMPTYKSTKGPQKHLRRALAKLGRGRWRWLEVDKKFVLWNGSELYIRTSDDKEGVPTRGLTIDGVLWVDEAGYVPRGAWEAARFTQGAIEDPLVIITTTPAGRTWVYDEFIAGCIGPQKNPLNESFRFKTTDSPYHNAQFVRDLRAKVGARRAMQELDAQFLGDAHAAFDPDHLAACFVQELPIRGTQFSIGVDLGKEQDFTVVTLMNEFGETWVLARFRDMEWPDQEERILQFAEEHKALVVLALGAGGGYGAYMFSRLKPVLGEGRLLGVKDAQLGVRGELIELLIGDVEAERLAVFADDEHGQQLLHEATFFEAHRQVIGGVERWKYHGPEGVERNDNDPDSEDHDDCVISWALANWGRVHGWDPDDGDGGLEAFRPGPRPGGAPTAPGRPRGGYMLR